MASPPLRPHLLTADEKGNLYDHPRLLMVCRRGAEFSLPRPDELMPLPEESTLFLLPDRRALGLDPQTGRLELQDELAVAAFVAPAHTLTAHPAYETGGKAPVLPLFAYGAVGFANGRLYVCAKKVDDDPRQIFRDIPEATLREKARALMRRFPDNRLMRHLAATCAQRYKCPAARNLCLGRYEAPLPVSHACNARCVGCISLQDEDSPIRATPQNRLTFTPTAEEIVEVMTCHGEREKRSPIYSFGQGCEGEPLTQSGLVAEAIRAFREQGGKGTININSNASLPRNLSLLAEAGLSSVRVSLNSARPEAYSRYYRPAGYDFSHVRESIGLAKAAGIFVSLNLLFFPGFSDCERESAALADLIGEFDIDFLQLRNLNIDPELYLTLMDGLETGPCPGFANFRKRLKKLCPRLRTGYFNPATE